MDRRFLRGLVVLGVGIDVLDEGGFATEGGRYADYIYGHFVLTADIHRGVESFNVVAGLIGKDHDHYVAPGGSEAVVAQFFSNRCNRLKNILLASALGVIFD